MVVGKTNKLTRSSVGVWQLYKYFLDPIHVTSRSLTSFPIVNEHPNGPRHEPLRKIAAMHNRSPHFVLGGEGECGYKRTSILEGGRFASFRKLRWFGNIMMLCRRPACMYRQPKFSRVSV
jgi:hypothetical protein